MTKPVVLFTNDDGIESPGIFAAAEAFADFAEPLVVAPRLQQSGMGRSLPNTNDGRIFSSPRVIGGVDRTVYAVDGSPAQAAQHGIIELAPMLNISKLALVVSGINYGENLGNGVTISGTVGAALEASSLGVPAIAVSQRTSPGLHLSYAPIDFSASAYFARLFGEMMMTGQFPPDVDILKIDIPLDATPQTPWRVTRVSRHRYYWPTISKRTALDQPARLGYEPEIRPADAELDSDMYAVFHQGIVSVTPMSLDMTSRIDLAEFQALLTSRLAAPSEVIGQAKNSPNGRA